MSNWHQNQNHHQNHNHSANVYYSRHYQHQAQPDAQAPSADYTVTTPSGNQINVSQSNLHANAAEFTPRQYAVSEGGPGASGAHGAVRKPPKLKNRKKDYHNNGYRHWEQNEFYEAKNGSAEEEKSIENDDRKSKPNDNRYYKGYYNNQDARYDRGNNGDYNKKKWNRNGNVKQNRKVDGTEQNWRERKDGKKDFDEKGQKNQNLQSNQRERLQDMLERAQLECMVCCERLRHSDPVWSCKQCYNVLHLKCVRQWAQTSKAETGWRCPACQRVHAAVPDAYYCHCEKRRDPRYEPGTAAHSCGETCGRRTRACDHPCTLKCHPGPCPECAVSVERACGCGRTRATVTCNAETAITCRNVCDKVLNCGTHRCREPCHAGECSPCSDSVRQECYCGKVGRKVACTADARGVARYECGDACGKPLSCGNHACELACHSGGCAPCETAPDVVATCHCGQTKLEAARASCLDPIPTCDKICNKLLTCGQPSQPHRCQEKCHKSDCPPCPLTTKVRCRCGFMDKEIACSDLKSKADDARCQKKCTKMRSCCKHKCNQLCCIEVEHPCHLPCNRALACGAHRCELACHRGRCPACPRVSFDELYCECGAAVAYPPVACGARPPACERPCSRARACGHEPGHACHAGPCPPCTVLCRRWCHGRHEQRSTVLCHRDEFGCGLPCGKDLPCGQHKCAQPCHAGACPLPCSQPCPRPRAGCEHACAAPCHPDAPCPDAPCRRTVRVTCECGLRSSERACVDLAGEYQAIAMRRLAAKMADIQKGQTVDLTDIVAGQKKGVTPKTLECTEECRVVERNRRLAIGLQIRNPDLSAKLTPRYSEAMRAWAKRDPRFCQHVHDRLTDLVRLAKQSKQRSRSHSFESMNREKRAFVHDYCEHFGCESAAYDAEPNRNVVATAHRDKSWLPSVGLLELVRRENGGQRKVPGPVPRGAVGPPKRDLVALRARTD